MFFWQLLLLAADPPAKPQEPTFTQAFLMPMVLIGVLWYFLLFRPQRREQSRRDDVLSQLKKNDRVVTIGGIIGTVAAVSDDKREVTVKVDDTTRIRFERSAIKMVLRADSSEAASAPADAAAGSR